MIKKILPILLISSCSYISYGQLPELIVQSVRGAPDIAITDNFLEQQQYSFAKFKMGKSVIAITVLAEIKGDTFVWISQDREKIYTKHGKIIETVGLSHDIKILDHENIVPWQSRLSASSLVQVSNPSAIISQDIKIKASTENDLNGSKMYVTLEPCLAPVDYLGRALILLRSMKRVCQSDQSNLYTLHCLK